MRIHTNFLKDYSPLRDTAFFPQLGSYLLKNKLIRRWDSERELSLRRHRTVLPQKVSVYQPL